MEVLQDGGELAAGWAPMSREVQTDYLVLKTTLFIAKKNASFLPEKLSLYT